MLLSLPACSTACLLDWLPACSGEHQALEQRLQQEQQGDGDGQEAATAAIAALKQELAEERQAAAEASGWRGPTCRGCVWRMFGFDVAELLSLAYGAGCDSCCKLTNSLLDTCPHWPLQAQRELQKMNESNARMLQLTRAKIQGLARCGGCAGWLSRCGLGGHDWLWFVSLLREPVAGWRLLAAGLDSSSSVSSQP
jgi:hypothetical protein